MEKPFCLFMRKKHQPNAGCMNNTGKTKHLKGSWKAARLLNVQRFRNIRWKLVSMQTEAYFPSFRYFARILLKISSYLKQRGIVRLFKYSLIFIQFLKEFKSDAKTCGKFSLYILR